MNNIPENIIKELKEAQCELYALKITFDSLPMTESIIESLCKVHNSIQNVLDYEEFEKYYE